VLLTRLREEVIQQERNVVAALPQGRDTDLDDVQPVIEILAECLGSDKRFEIPVRRGNQANVDVHRRAIRSYRLYFSGFCESEQHRLHPEAHLTEFVQKQRAAVTVARKTRFVAVGAGEAAARVAEQLRLEQRFWNAAAIDGDEGLEPTRAPRVDQPGNQFFSGAGFAQNEDFGVGAGGALDVAYERLRRGGRANE
jgi:hypothetical protein